jgi:co-chaperonin GroES (HSP10)
LLTKADSKPTLWGVIACYALAFACLAGATYQAGILLSLMHNSQEAQARVIDVDVGVKGNKRALLRFVTETGDTIIARDMFDMLLFRFEQGDSVTVLYDPSDTRSVTIDLGLWLWLQPAVFMFGFFFLVALGMWLSRLRRRGSE